MSVFGRRGGRVATYPALLLGPSIPALIMFGAFLGAACFLWPMLGFDSDPYIMGQATSSTTVGYDVVAAAESLPTTLTVTRITSVYDGDTFRIESSELVSHDEKGISIRIRGVDAAEIDGNCEHEVLLAKASRQWLVWHLSRAQIIKLQNLDYIEDPHGRVVADVLIDGKALDAQMIAAGAANSWKGGSKPFWCDRT